MNNAEKESIIRFYFEMWTTRNFEQITTILAPDIYYSECYGPEYQGFDQILQWINKMLKTQTVLEWSIKRLIHQDNSTAVEWRFREKINNRENQFDGVSIIDFNSENKIISIKEFSSNYKPITPDQSSRELVQPEMKMEILEHLCYTDLVFGRINKKLKMNLDPAEMKAYVYSAIESPDCRIYKQGKNYYAANQREQVQVTINSYNYRVITASRI